ncbi:MAG: serine/threonine-protein phosphatase [Ignavibacteriales bacterium]|nr:serine/threonine-protein phosphatase [Ignavibacteriales bacterium]
MAHLQASAAEPLSARLAVGGPRRGCSPASTTRSWTSTARQPLRHVLLRPLRGRLAAACRYANCGHVAAHACCGTDGTVVTRLGVTAGAIGIFDEWTGSAAEIVLEPGDLLAAFSDGVTEAMNAAGEEYGEARLRDLLVASRRQPLRRSSNGWLARSVRSAAASGPTTSRWSSRGGADRSAPARQPSGFQ